VLAFYCPAGSRITGYEVARPLLEVARRRSYLHWNGQPATVTFCCQGLTESFRDGEEVRLPDGGVDLVNASGVLGHHLDRGAALRLAEELRRVLAAGAVAMLDVGPTLPDRELTKIMASVGFRRLGRYRSWILDPTGQVVFQRQE
jgi:hypothetical protein